MLVISGRVDSQRSTCQLLNNTPPWKFAPRDPRPPWQGVSKSYFNQNITSLSYVYNQNKIFSQHVDISFSKTAESTGIMTVTIIESLQVVT